MPISQFPRFMALMLGLLIVGGLLSAWGDWEAVKQAHWSTYAYVVLGLAVGIFAIREMQKHFDDRKPK